MRFDSGFWSNATIATLERLDVGYTMGVKMVKSVKSAVVSDRRVRLGADRIHR